MSKTLSAALIADQGEEGAQKWHGLSPGPDTVSLLMGTLLAAGAVVFLWGFPGWSPKQGGVLFIYLAPWLSLLYLAPQIYFLIQSVRRIQTISLVDLGGSSLPIAVGLVALVEKGGGHLALSGEQANLVLLMIAMCITDVALTVYMKFAMQGRNIVTSG